MKKRIALRAWVACGPSNKSEYSLGSRRPLGRDQSFFEIVRNAWFNGTILRVWSWTFQVVELGNSPWVSVEPWAALQLRRLAVVRLIAQGERQLRSALQLLETVKLEFRLRVDLRLPYFRFVWFVFSLKVFGNLPLPPCRVIWAYNRDLKHRRRQAQRTTTGSKISPYRATTHARLVVYVKFRTSKRQVCRPERTRVIINLFTQCFRPKMYIKLLKWQLVIYLTSKLCVN